MAEFSQELFDTMMERAIPICVYVLRCPDSMDVRYVGVTKEPKRRLARHITEARSRKTHRHNWIMSLVDKGKRPIFEIVEEDVDDWKEAEPRWIAHFTENGCRLVNGNGGGDCMRQARKISGLWPNYKSVMARLGRDISFLKKNALNGSEAKLAFAREKLRAAADLAKASGRMDDLDRRLFHIANGRDSIG